MDFDVLVSPLVLEEEVVVLEEEEEEEEEEEVVVVVEEEEEEEDSETRPTPARTPSKQRTAVVIWLEARAASPSSQRTPTRASSMLSICVGRVRV